MGELIRTNDVALIAVTEAVLKGAGIPCFVADRNSSVMEGSIQFIQMRVLVPDDVEDDALEVMREADLGEWLRE
jgi:hypothetical protein